MNTKLTLKLNKKAIDRAKKYAQKNKQSLSVMVEKYFNLISAASDKSDKESITEVEISPNVLELSGIIKLPENINLKEIYRNYIEVKYSK